MLAELCRFRHGAGRRTDRLVKRLAQLDPLTPVTQLVVCFHHSLCGRFQESIPSARRAIEMTPGVSPLHTYAGWILAQAGLREEATEILGRVGTAFEGTVNGSWALFLKHALERNAEEALAHATPELEQIRIDHMTRILADGYALIGRSADAIRWTRIAVQCGFVNYPFLSRHDPFLGGVRTEPELQAMMDELRKLWEAVPDSERQPLES